MVHPTRIYRRAFNLRSQIAYRIRSGPSSLFNLSLYSFGMSGILTGFGSIILPFKVINIIEEQPIEMLGIEMGKNALLAFISLLGLLAVAVVQPISGLISDHVKASKGGESQRLPFVIFGLFGLSAMTLIVGFAHTFITVLLVTLAMQIIGNIAQGPANALIIDHVEDSQRGKASGVLNLMRFAGAGIVTMIVVALMANYDSNLSPQWMWYGIVVMATVSAATTTYTFFVLRLSTRKHRAPPKTDHPVFSSATPDGTDSDPAESVVAADIPPVARVRTETACKPKPSYRLQRGPYIMFLIALAFALAAMSAIQTNALFFFQDVLEMENPTRGGNYIIVALIGTSIAVVYPAGKLSDHIGRGTLLLLGGFAGAAGVVWLVFIESFVWAIPATAVIGIAVGLYLSVGWAFANDLVSRKNAARDLGLTSISALLGSVVGRASGFGINALNDSSYGTQYEYLGYDAMLIGSATAFIISGIMFSRVVSRN